MKPRNPSAAHDRTPPALPGRVRPAHCQPGRFRRLFARLLFVLLFPLAAGCNFSDPAAANTTSTQKNVSLIQSRVLSLTDEAAGFSSRPEIAATDSRIFVIYLNDNKAFIVKMFDQIQNAALSSSTLVMQSSEYGTPTDLRLVQDDNYAYVFYETVSSDTTYLWAAKYSLNDTFDLVAATGVPLITGRSVMNLSEGDEVLNDPAPLLTPKALFIVTRLISSLSTAGKTIYRVHELNAEDLSEVNQFDLDLSSVAKGRARVASLFYHDNAIYMAVPSTVSDEGLFDNLIADDGALTEIVLVKMGSDWTFDAQADASILSSHTGYVENYVNGFQTDGTYVYMSYKQSKGTVGTGEQASVIKIYDLSFQELLEQTVKKATWGFGEIRPSQQLRGTTLYSGQTNAQGGVIGDADVTVYTVVR